MPSKGKVTYGPTLKKRAKRLLEALLAYVNGELEDVNGISLSYRWEEYKKTKQPKQEDEQPKIKLIIETKLRVLEYLTEKDQHEGKLTKPQIRQALNDHFKDFLHILDDTRAKTQGKEDWNFTLKLWSKDKEKNLEQFEIEWERKRPEKSKQQEETIRKEVAKETVLAQDKTLAHQDWGDAASIPNFFGRTEELQTLEKWILQDKCRLVVIVGMGGIGKTELSIKLGKGGIGKTDLSLKLAKGIQDEFDYIIWRSLLNAPTLTEILIDLIKFLSSQLEINLPDKEEDKISRLLYYLGKHRCLVILDNSESVLRQGDGSYREGYEGYGKVLMKVAEVEHKSCLLLTSREKPRNIIRLDGKNSPLRFFELHGLDYQEGRKIFETKGYFYGSDTEWKELIEFYDGNPLALELAASHIQLGFNNNIAEFLANGKYLFNNLCDLLDWHFNRLSEREKEILYWLAINRIHVSLSDLTNDVLSIKSQNEILYTLESLKGKLPLEKIGVATKFTLQPVLIEYMTKVFIEKILDEIAENNIKICFFNQYAIIKALSNEYVMSQQRRLILNPIIEGLRERFGKKSLENKLIAILNELHNSLEGREGYAGGNLIDLLLHLKIDLTNYDFSHLRIRQAYLQEYAVKRVNFSYCDLSDSVVSEDFGTVISIDYIDSIAVGGTTSGDIHLWEIEKEKRIRTFKGHSDWVWGVALSPNGDYLASSGGDKTVRLWNIKNGDLIQLWSGHNTRIRGLAFSPKADLVASGDEQGEVRLWSVQSGQCTNLLRFQRSVWANTIAFSPDGSLLAVGSQNAILKIWDVYNNQEVKKIKDYKHPIRSIVFSPDASLIAIAGDSSEIWLIDVRNWKCYQKLSGYEGWIRDVNFSADSKKLASCGADQTIRVWNLETSECIQTIQGHTKPVRCIAFQNQTILSASEDQTIRLWDANSGKCLRVIQGYTNPVWSIAVSPTSLFVASGDEDSFIRLWNISQENIPESITTHQVLGNHSNLVRTLAFNSDGSLLASGSYDGTVKVWQLSDHNSRKLVNQKEPDDSRDRVISVAFCPLDSIVAISYYYGEKVNLWNFKTRQLIDRLLILNSKGERIRSRDVAFSPDGHILAISSEEHYIRLWDMRTKQYLKPLEGHKDAVWSVSFSPDGKSITSCDGNGSIRLWNLETYESTELEGHKLRVRSIAFSPDGKKLVTGSDDKSLKIWDVNSKECLATLEGHKSWIWSVAFSYDNNIVVSGSDDDTVKIWNVETGKCVSTLRPDRPYEGMNITGVTGLTDPQKEMLKNLGAFEE